jgi:RHS repeat-associated protein
VAPNSNSSAGANPATYLYYDSQSLREQGGWSLIQEGGSSTSAQRLYIHGGRVDEIVKSINCGSGQSAFHHYDARGHCTLLTNTSAGILEQYDYDAFGWPYFYNAGGTLVTSSAYGNRFLFTGREWLSDLKLYDYRNRMYQPELGRFLQPDPKQFAAGDYNLYRYCHNDPVNKSDPTGLTDEPFSDEAHVFSMQALNKLFADTRSDRTDRTQPVVSINNTLSTLPAIAGVVNKVLLNGRLQASTTRTETFKEPKGLISLLHTHNDANGGSTKKPGGDDYARVKDIHVRLYFKSEDSAKEGKIIILVPQKERNLEPRKIELMNK